MRHLFSILLFLPLLALAQSRSCRLTIAVTSVEGDYLTGQPVTLTQTDYQVGYGALTLSREGTLTLNVYPGGHELTLERDGFQPLQETFNVEGDTTLHFQLREATRSPYALQAAARHDAVTGQNAVDLSWNQEPPAFFDDFEAYDPFAITFGQWTGIDGDGVPAAALVGAYPNRQTLQYAQVINPLTVNPTWWYDYPVLRPYSGKQYAGFIRTQTGAANDDWLVSPPVEVGTDQVLSFMAKAADVYTERFMVYVTEKEGDLSPADFTRIDPSNYETATYAEWQPHVYSLAQYAGRRLRFAIRYVSDANQWGAFMLMVDDVYVGPRQQHKARARRSEANPNERFRVYLDGQPAGETTGYAYTLTDVAPGRHTVGVQAAYLHAESDTTTAEVAVPDGPYARLTFEVEAQSVLPADGTPLVLTNMLTADSLTLPVSEGKVELKALPLGQYVAEVHEGAYEAFSQTLDVARDTTVRVQLTDHIREPFNITHREDTLGLHLYWNQRLTFSDSFEDYPDFATTQFGPWLAIDGDQQPVYPISLGGKMVTFPGSGDATNPRPLGPMVFNPYETQPAMMPADPAIGAPTGQKTVIFFSPQRAQADKWLISPLIDVREGYDLTLKAKGYTSAYPEQMSFCVSTGSAEPKDFVALAEAAPLASEAWTEYRVPLTDYVGQAVRVAVHYTSTDAFLSQVDDIAVGPADGRGEAVDYGNVLRYEVYLDGQLVGSPVEPAFTLPPLTAGHHVVTLRAVYLNGQSGLVEYPLDVTAIKNVNGQPSTVNRRAYDLQGRPATPGRHGIYIIGNRKALQ